MILEYLPPSHVIQFLRVSKGALIYTNKFCAQNPHYFYQCSDAFNNVIIALIRRFSSSDYRELDMRWKIVSRIANIAALTPLIPKDSIDTMTLNPRAPLQPISHRFGLHEVIVRIPDHIKAIDVCSIVVEGHYYVCGIGFQSKATYSFYGNRTGLLQRSSFPNTVVDTFGFAVDALGMRCIKWGDFRLSSEGLDSIGCWEGLSLKHKRQEVRIIYDVSIQDIVISWLLTWIIGAEASIY